MFYCNVAFYATFMVMLTIMTLLLGNMSQCDNEMNNLESNNDLNCSKYNKVSDKNFWTVLERHIENQENSYQNTLGYLFIVSFIMTILGLVFITIREIVQLITNFKKYFESSESLVEALLIILTTLTIILMFHDKDLAIHTGKNLWIRGLLQRHCLLSKDNYIYCKVVSINTSQLRAPCRFYGLFIKLKFNVYLLWPFEKNSFPNSQVCICNFMIISSDFLPSFA